MRGVLYAGMLLIYAACSSTQQSENLVVAEKVFTAFNEHDWHGMATLYAENAQFLDPSFGKEFVSKKRSETVAKYTELQEMFPDIHDRVTAMYPYEKTVVVEFVSTGTAPDGTKFSLPIISVLTIENGLIVKDATYYDL
jgi:ketosteroid isomerase-like protein